MKGSKKEHGKNHTCLKGFHEGQVLIPEAAEEILDIKSKQKQK
jgi:hypothetical protein